MSEADVVLAQLAAERGEVACPVCQQKTPVGTRHAHTAMERVEANQARVEGKVDAIATALLELGKGLIARGSL